MIMKAEGNPLDRPPLLTAREAARYLNVSLTTLAKIEETGLLVPFRTPGGHRRYSLSMLEKYLEESQKWSHGGTRRKVPHDGGNGDSS
jgi:excisionase family DNA binding protein